MTREKKLDCKNEAGAVLGDEVLIEVPEALEGMNALLFFLPIVLTMIVFMTGRLRFGSQYSVHILISTLLSFFIFKYLSDKIIMARTKNSFFESRIIKILK